MVYHDDDDYYFMITRKLATSSAIKKVFKCVAVTIIFTSLAVVSVYENYDSDFELSDDDTNPDSNITTSRDSLNLKAVPECFIDDVPFALWCYSIVWEDAKMMVYAKLEEAKQLEDQQGMGFALEFQKIDFKYRSILKNWLVLSPDHHPKVFELHIDHSNLAYLGPDCFSSFPDLSILCIVQTEIVHLSMEAFSNLPNLISLNFRENFNLTSADYGLLSNFKKLGEIQIQNVMEQDPECSNKIPQFFKNLTGNFTGSKVYKLDFESTCLVNITKDFFAPYPNLAIIYMMNNHLENFEEGSLDGLGSDSSQTLLYIEYNKIKKLPENVFGNFIRKNNGVLNVLGNKLQCDCEMKWLQDFVVIGHGYGYGDDGIDIPRITYGDFDSVICDKPEKVPFFEADMCPDDGSDGFPTISPTTEPSTTVATTQGTIPTSESAINTTGNITPPTTTELIPTTDSKENETNPVANSTDMTTTEWNLTTYTPPPDSAGGDGGGFEDQIVEIKCTPQNKIAASRIIRSVSLYSSIKILGNVTDQGEFVFTLAPKTQRFRVSDPKETSVQITFEQTDTNLRKNVLWLTYNDFPKLKKSDTISSNCSTISPKEPYIIKHLEPEKSYLICVSDDQNSNVNLLDCVPYTTKPLVENQAWLTFGSKPMAIVMVVGASLGAFLVGCGILYYLVRRNPTLIEGSKSVIVVKRQEKKQVMIMPKDYDVSTIKELPRKLSDAYSVVSYISAIQPSPEELLSYRLERLKEKEKLMPMNSNSTPRSSVKTMMSDYTIYENDFELSPNFNQEYCSNI